MEPWWHLQHVYNAFQHLKLFFELHFRFYFLLNVGDDPIKSPNGCEMMLGGKIKLLRYKHVSDISILQSLNLIASQCDSEISCYHTFEADCMGSPMFHKHESTS